MSKLAAYYATHGYVPVPIKSVVIHLAPKSAKAAHAAASQVLTTEVVPTLVGAPDLTATIAEIHRRGIESLTGCFARTTEYWGQWIADATRPGAGYTIRVVRDARANCVGYGLSRVGAGPVYGGVLQITEFFCSAQHDEDRQACFLCYLDAEIAGCEVRPQRVRILPSTIDATWLASVVGVAPVESANPIGAPVQEGGTLVCSEQNADGTSLWTDKGQMFRAVGRPTADTHPGEITDGRHVLGARSCVC